MNRDDTAQARVFRQRLATPLCSCTTAPTGIPQCCAHYLPHGSCTHPLIPLIFSAQSLHILVPHSRHARLYFVSLD